MSYNIHPELGLINRGNLNRIKKVMRRAEAGDRITVGFLGGSITQGSLAEFHSNCYAHLVFKWWTEKFPKSAFTYVNAGIGGTDSEFGVARVDRDLMQFLPDMVFTEFSVNDSNNDLYKETYEGLIRHVLDNRIKPAVALIHNICYDTGVTAQEIHSEIGRHYELPCIAMQPTIYAKVIDGTIPNREITPDDLHPNTLGHSLVASVIIHFLEMVYSQMYEEEAASVCDEKLPAPITDNRYEHSYRIQNGVNFDNALSSVNGTVNCDGFTIDEQIQYHVYETDRNGWKGSRQSDSIRFEVDADTLAVQYIKTVNLPAPIAKAIVDGDEENAVILDANFDETWGNCLYLQNLPVREAKKRHTVEIKVVETHDNDAYPFYLVSLIAGLK
ncbi:MAG: SGNH/GDSL hydrolase family protein [Lachnospiraceae bacterium]|nr:SGNH/GDSL hydrolase family protein [Candidatus Merdinaster equi]